MARLFEMSREYEELFDAFELIDDLEPNINDDGEPVDYDGNVIDDIEAWHDELKKQWFSELASKKDEVESKAESVAQYIKSLTAETDALAAEIKILQQRKKSKESKIENMKNYLKDCLIQTGMNKIETSRCLLSIRNNAESVSIQNEKEFIEQYKNSHTEYFKFKPEISKTEIKKILQSGMKIDGATLERTQSIIIK